MYIPLAAGTPLGAISELGRGLVLAAASAPTGENSSLPPFYLSRLGEALEVWAGLLEKNPDGL